MRPMRLYKRGKYYYVEFGRGQKRSTKETDLERARGIFREMKREHLKGRLVKLESGRRVTLAEFTKVYTERPYSSDKTAKADSLALRLLADVVKGSTPLFALTPKKIDEFRAACLARKVRPSSVNSYLRHIKAALGVAEDWYPGYRRPKIKLCKVGAHLPRALSPDQVKDLVTKTAELDPGFLPMLTIYLWTGIRRSELLDLKWENIDLTMGAARVTGKGDKERVIPLLPKVKDVLRPMEKDIGPVFPGCHPDTLTHRFQAVVSKCGFSCRLHDLRHSAATYMLASGTPIKVVQAVLGHSSVTTTEIYAKVLSDVVMKETRLSYD